VQVLEVDPDRKRVGLKKIVWYKQNNF
jgi:hypothetical protein